MIDLTPEAAREVLEIMRACAAEDSDVLEGEDAASMLTRAAWIRLYCRLSERAGAYDEFEDLMPAALADRRKGQQK